MAMNPSVVGASITIGIAFILIVVGLATTGWTPNLGLFIYCVGSVCIDMPDYLKSDEMKATAAMVILGVLGAACALSCIIVFLVFGAMGKEGGFTGLLPGVTLVASAAGGAFTLLGCIIFAATYYGPIIPSYSFFITLVGGITLIGGGVSAYNAKNSGVGASQTA